MTLATVKAVAHHFLTSKEPEILAIKGSWGVGKTFAWHQIVRELKNQISLPSYCYVSLFGIASLSELRTAIFAKAQPVKLIGEKLDVETINTEWMSLGWNSLRSITHGLSKFKDAPYIKNLSIGLETIAPHLIKNMIICLDDLERVNSDHFKIDELLGLISSLKEEKRCKVVLIFNEEKITPATVYKTYREKVIDIELLFAPSAEEAADLAIPSNLPNYAAIKKFATTLGIKNIRILRRIISLVELIHPQIKHLHPNVAEQAAMTVVVLAWCYYDTNEKTPSVQFVLEWNQIMWGFNEHKGKESDARRIEWAAVLRNYGLMRIDEFDLTIYKVIEHGYVEESGLSKAASNLDAQIRANELESSFSSAWELFHNSFADNKDELIRNMTDSFRRSVHQISPMNLNGTVGLLRKLVPGNLADELIDYYIESRSKTVERRFFNLEEYPFSGDVTDAAIKDKFAKRYAESQQLPSLNDAVAQIAKDKSCSKAQLQTLELASEDDFFNLFKGDHGDNLAGIVKACLQFENWPENKAIGRKARAALERIGRESDLNQLRVARYGVTVEPIVRDGRN